MKLTEEQARTLIECAALNDRLAKLLAETAIALKGEEAALTRHSWHDLPVIALAKMVEISELTRQRDLAVSAFKEIINMPQIGTNGTRIWRIAMKALSEINIPPQASSQHQADPSVPSVIWEVMAFGKTLCYVTSPVRWDAHGVKNWLFITAGYSHDIEVKIAKIMWQRHAGESNACDEIEIRYAIKESEV